MHDLIGDVGDAEARYEELVRRMAGDKFWELLVANFAASGAITVGDPRRAERAARRGLDADPEGISAFWSMAARAYLGAALCLQGDLDQGLPILDEAWSRYVQMGLRTNGVTLLASRALGLAEAGRVDEAAEALVAAQRELTVTQERYAEPTLLLAEGVVRHVRGDEKEEVSAVLRKAVEVATASGGHAVVRRVTATAERLGVGI